MTVKVDGELTDFGRRVRQGSCVSPAFFNLYAEKKIEEALEKIKGILEARE